VVEHPWDQQSDEPQEAHAAFLAYLKQGQGKRNIVDAYRQVFGNPSAKQASGQWNRWVKRFDWDGRARLYDNWLQRQRDNAAAREAAKWEARRQEALERGWENAQKLYEQAEQMRKWPLQTQRTSKDGKKVIIKPARWSKDTMFKMLRMAAELEAAVLAAASKDPADMSAAELEGTISAGLSRDAEVNSAANQQGDE
jgi:hypothetical protein